jgi:hypothetical protein
MMGGRHISLREFMNTRKQIRWLAWLGLWLIADYSMRIWTAALLPND